MDMYTGFAGIYDEFMDNIPYERIVEDLLSLMNDYGISPKDGPVVELGCGTGTITRAVADRGYHIIGVDLSEEMLNVAWQQETETEADLEFPEEAEAEEDIGFSEEVEEDTEFSEEETGFPLHGGRILYSCQDITKLDLEGRYSFVFALSDTMNYLTEDGDFLQALRNVRECLSDGGRFVFDLKTEYLYAEEMGDRTIVDSREDATLIWENTYDPEEHINEYALTMFQKKEPSGLYEKFEEYHYQRAYTKEEVFEAAKQAGLTAEAYFEAYTHKDVSEKTERVYVILRKDPDPENR